MHHSTTRKVKSACLPDPTGLGVHDIYHIFGSVSVRSHPEPHHMGNGRITEGKPQRHEGQHCRKFHTLCKCTDDERAGNACKGGLKSSKNNFRNDNTLAERGSIDKSARCVVPYTWHQQPVKPSKERIAFCKRQTVAVEKPQHHNHREGHHHLHQHRQHVFGTNQPAIKQRQSWYSH